MFTKKKRKPSIYQSNHQLSQRAILQCVAIAYGIVLFAVTGLAYQLDNRFILPPIVIGLWILGSILTWQYTAT